MRRDDAVSDLQFVGELDNIDLETIDWRSEPTLSVFGDSSTSLGPPVHDSTVVNKIRNTKDSAFRASTAGIVDQDCDDAAQPSAYIIPATSASTVQLQLVNSQLKDINTLFQRLLFPKLRYLNLSFNLLRGIGPSAIALSFANIQLLDISHNRISSLDFVPSLSRLSVLRCQYNQIESLSPVQHLVALEELWISNNKIDWMQLMYLSMLSKLTKLVKVNTPANEKNKVDEFLVTIVPSLVTIDGDLASKHRHSSSFSLPSEGAGRGNPTATLLDNAQAVESSRVSTDVRVMITQSKAMLKRESEQSTLGDDSMHVEEEAGNFNKASNANGRRRSSANASHKR